MSTLKFFTHNVLKNCHIQLTPTGCVVWVSLNVSKAVSEHLSPNNIYKAEKRLVYALKMDIPEVNTRNVSDSYDILLNKCMIHCREAKIKTLEKQISVLTN